VGENRRTQTRHEVDLAVAFTVDGKTTNTQMINLSLGGAFIGGQRVTMGQRVSVKFKLPADDEAIEVGGTVRWSTEQGVGIQFDGLRAREVWALNKFFEQLTG
jgi:hypothetical protein